MPAITKGKSVIVGYAMEEMFTSFWARRTEVGEGKTFASRIDFAGERCNVLACPKQFGGAFMGNRGDSPSGPWNQEAGAGTKGNGSQFFDPAFTMSKRLSFVQPIALDYCHNPYVGIVDQCAKPPSTDATSPGHPSTPAEPSHPSASAGTSSAGDDARETDVGAGDSGCSTTARRADPSFVLLALITGVLARRGSAGRRCRCVPRRNRICS